MFASIAITAIFTGVLVSWRAEEARSQDLDQDEPGQSEAVGGQRHRSHAGVLLGKGAVLDQRGQDRHREHDQAGRGRQRHQQRQAQRPVQGAPEGGLVGAGMLAGQARQDHRGDRDAEQRQGQLDEAIAEIQPRDRTCDQEGRNHGVHQQVDLHDRCPEDRRQHQARDFPDPGVGAPEPGPGQQPGPYQERHLEGELQNSRKEYTPGECNDGLGEQGRTPQRRRDQRQVQEHRGEGRHSETADAVQDPGAPSQ
jgi:hypothetical protein